MVRCVTQHALVAAPPTLYLVVLRLVNGQVTGFAGYKDVVFSDKGITCGGNYLDHGSMCWGTRKDNGRAIVWGDLRPAYEHKRVCLWEERGPRAGQGRVGAVSCLRLSPALGLHPLYVYRHIRLLWSLTLGACRVRQALGTMSKSS